MKTQVDGFHHPNDMTEEEFEKLIEPYEEIDWATLVKFYDMEEQ